MAGALFGAFSSPVATLEGDILEPRSETLQHGGVSVRMRLFLGWEGTTMTFIKMLRDDSGASAAEYALILAIVGAGIAGAAVALGGSIKTAMDDAGNCIENPPAAGGACP